MNQLNIVNSMTIEKVLGTRKKEGEEPREIPYFKPGDTVIVAVRVIEGEKERIQNYKGIVIKRRGAGINQTFLVRKISNGVGVERIFPLYSPMIDSITVVQKGNARRAKLYYLRGMSEKKIRQKLN